jgi:BRO1-like domain
VLKELVQSQDFGTVDLSQSMLTFWEKYLLAEAQTFVYRMASLAADVDSKHGTLSVLAKSAHLLFNEALSAAQDARLQSEVPKHCEQWGTYCKAQSMMCSSKATYHASVVHRLNSEWGKEIARLRECLVQLQAAQQFLKSVVASGSTTTTGDDEALLTYTRRECATYLPVVQDRLTEAERDNYRVYGDEIPKSLDDIVPKQLVKNTGGYPQSMLVPKKKLFQFLVVDV